MHARGIASAKPLVRAGGSITKSHLTNQTNPSGPGHDRLTIAKFTSQYRKNFPVNFTVCKGYYGPSEDLKFSEGDKFQAHSVKPSTVVNVEYDNGIRENIPVDSSIPFAILFDPYNNTKESMKGYRFEKVSELVQLPVLPPVLWSRKSYHGSSADSSVSANELLIVRRVKSRLVGRQQLKVYSHTQKKEKTLYTTCVGSFSTKPRDISLYLVDILKHMPDIFPCRAVMMNSEVGPSQNGIMPSNRHTGPCIVTLMHSSIDTSLVISSTLQQGSQQSKTLEIPLNLGIMVKLDGPLSENGDDGVYEDTSKFEQPVPGRQSAPAAEQSQLYTNILFGQERSVVLQKQPQMFPSTEAALEQGHYQAPRDLRVPSDPIPIDSVYHPPDMQPSNYVLLSKHNGSLEKSPGSNEASPHSPSWRPPLPPPNKIKREHVHSPEYSYVDTNPMRSTSVYSEGQPSRDQAADNGGTGAGLATSYPDSAYSDKSFGSSGSGGATVRRGSINGKPHPVLGSGDGIVERSMRCSSVSSAGYSYAKTNPPHPHHLPPSNLPTSPHHYSHLRSRSGPPVLPQVPLQLSTQAPQAVQPTHPQGAIAGNAEQFIIAPKQQISPPASNGNQLTRNIHRQESAPVFTNSADASSRPDSLSGVIDDLTKMTQELGLLEENIFASDGMSPTSEVSATSPAGQTSSTGLACPTGLSTVAEERPRSNDQSDVLPEVVEKNRAYLKAMDNFQILRLLEIMGLEQYTPTFKLEQINGDILSGCDDTMLNEDLKVSSRLHRMRLLRVIQGMYSVHDIMAGKDGYIFMTSAAGKQ